MSIDYQNVENWEKVGEQLGVQAFLKKSSDSSTLLLKMQFHKRFDIYKLVKAINDIKFRKNWDKDIQKGEQMALREGVKCFGKTYILKKKVLNFAPRDDYQKHMSFL